MEHLAITQVSEEEDQGPSGMASTVSKYEYYWAYLGKNEGGSLEDQAEELWDACKVAFHAIPDDFINKLYDSLPNQMATVLQAKGTHTRY